MSKEAKTQNAQAKLADYVRPAKEIGNAGKRLLAFISKQDANVKTAILNCIKARASKSANDALLVALHESYADDSAGFIAAYNELFGRNDSATRQGWEKAFNLPGSSAKDVEDYSFEELMANL